MAIEPMQRVAPSRRYGWAPLEKAKLVEEWARDVFVPGNTINEISGKDIEKWRRPEDRATPVTGLTAAGTKDVPGAWDPAAYMPRFVFDRREDALPVDPDFDGNGSMNDNAPDAANGKPGSYQDGMIGGKQALNGFVGVSKKGDYTVMTYSFYYAHNKAGKYHNNDYSTAQVFLKEGQPAYLYTSWHHGARMTPWNELQKDAQGRPIIKVGLGSHSLLALADGEHVDRDGLEIAGDGSASFAGKPLAQRLHLDTFQGNVKADRRLDPKSGPGLSRMRMLGWGVAALNPFLPTDFSHRTPLTELWHKVKGAVGKKRDWIASKLGF
ncbi:MAG: hypothetical protein JWM80_2418 [Cyanobacteria bacterium RYN_339]|nr:hypothetical protein [Cyanobacteria bacterium RYN_339]